MYWLEYILSLDKVILNLEEGSTDVHVTKISQCGSFTEFMFERYFREI